MGVSEPQTFRFVQDDFEEKTQGNTYHPPQCSFWQDTLAVSCSRGKQEEAQDELLYSSLGLASLAAITSFVVLSRKHHSKLMRALPDDFE